MREKGIGWGDEKWRINNIEGGIGRVELKVENENGGYEIVWEMKKMEEKEEKWEEMEGEKF